MNTSGQNNTLNKKPDSLTIRTKDLLKYYTKNPIQKNDSIAEQGKSKFSDKKHMEVPDSLKDLKPKLPGDSIKPNLNRECFSGKDSSNKHLLHKSAKRIFPHGTISVGYDYGFLPYTVNTSAPASAIKTEGLIEADIFNIPLDISYFYTTQKNLIGLNNYFRISYNADRYKEKLNNKLGGKLDSYKNNLGQLNTRKQQLMQKMAYADYLSSINPDKWPVDSFANKNPVSVPNLKLDTGEIAVDPIKLDTAGFIASATDTLKNDPYYKKADSIQRQSILYKNKVDSVAKLYDVYKNKYTLLNDSIKKLQNKIDELESLNQSPSSYSQKSPYLNKIQNFLSGVKKMEVGLCYPAYSTFLTNNIPVRGINFEYQKNNRLFAFTYGTTVSSLLYSNRNIEGFLQNIRNSYNYFDVNNLSAGRKIFSAKFGVGQKEGDHFFAGLLIGKSASTYFPATSEISTPTSVESNLVLEADIRRKLSKNTTLDVVLGKSSVQDADLNMNTLRTAAKELFSNYRSYALLVKLKTSIPATKSNLNFSVRWVDPFFNSFGIGFIRSDNMRYEAKLDQPLGKLLRYTVAIRYEEDNLLKLLKL